MKHLILILSLSLICFNTLAQDLLVKQNNDSINCKITSIGEDKISYYYKANQYNVTKENIKDYQLKYFLKYPGEIRRFKAKENAAREKVNEEREIVNEKDNRKGHLSISVHGGYSYTIGPVADEIDNSLKSYYEDLKSGRHFGAEIYYYTKRNWGFGLCYDQFSTSNSLDNVLFTDSNNITKIGILSDEIIVRYTAVTAAKRFEPSKVISFEVFTSLGYLSYENNLRMIDLYNVTGFTFVQTFGGAIDIKIADNIFAEMRVSIKGGGINKFKSKDEERNVTTIILEDNQAESVSRLDLSLGLKCRF